MSKYYVVAKGKKTGIFKTWTEVKSLVIGFPGSKYKSFKTLSEAQTYLYENNKDISDPKNIVSKLTEGKITETKQKEVSCFGRYDLPFSYKGDTIIGYTDGSCVKGMGGFGYLVIRKKLVLPVAGRVKKNPCTNQIAELRAIYEFIKHSLRYYPEEVKKDGVSIYSDSMYSINCLTKWCHSWKQNGWINSKGQPVKNQTLIKKILVKSLDIKITYSHVKAHRGNFYNEWADRLANQGRSM